MGLGFPGVLGLGFPGVLGLGFPGVLGLGFPGVLGLGFPGVLGLGFWVWDSPEFGVLGFGILGFGVPRRFGFGHSRRVRVSALKLGQSRRGVWFEVC